MKKTLLALALSTLPLAAAADVTLYGTIKGGLEYTKVNAVDNTVTNINDWGSYIGFKGEEDLGNGLKAIWQIEQAVSLDSKSSKNDRWANRDSFIGLSGGFGTLRAGYLSDSFKTDLETLDDWEGNGVRTLGSYTQFGERHTAVRYDSPDFGGFTFNALYSPEDNNRYDDARGTEGVSKVVSDSLGANYDGFQGLVPVVNTVTRYRDVLTVGLGYENAGWFVKYAYKNARNLTHPDLNGEVHGTEFGYNANNIFAGLGYKTSRNYVGAYRQTDEGAFTFAYTAGNIVPRISYAYGTEKERHVQHAEKIKYSQVIVGVDYNLSKRTTVLASLGYWNDKPRTFVEVRDRVTDVGRGDGNKRYKASKDRTEVYSLGLGLRHKF